jgi:cell fate (sporulation/competence/biofilm development) regulator YlbF (YheA/YmcA/DUF963 family)
MDNNIIRLAIELGGLIKKDERLVRLNATEKAFNEDQDLSTLIARYNVQQQVVQDEAAKPDGERDMLLIDTLQKALDDLYNRIMEHPTYVAYIEAKEEANKLLAEVNNIIMFQITGKTACTHDCSTCGGGCHDNDAQSE